MSRSKYENTVSKIKASDEFKSDTISNLKTSLKNKEERYNRKIRYDYRKIGTLAACFVFAISIGVSIKLFNKPENKLVDEPNNPPYVEENNEKYLESEYLASLPKLNVFNEFGGMGFGAYMAYLKLIRVL